MRHHASTFSFDECLVVERIDQTARIGPPRIRCAIDEGLLTPVIRNAQTKTLNRISQEAKEFAEKARKRKLTPNEMTGSTFTVSNLGMFGISNFFGIINPPNSAILAGRRCPETTVRDQRRDARGGPSDDDGNKRRSPHCGWCSWSTVSRVSAEPPRESGPHIHLARRFHRS